MSHRYRFLGRPGCDGHWLVEGQSEVRHLRQVLRLGIGDEVEVADGCGSWCVGRIEQMAAAEVQVRPHEVRQVTRSELQIEIAIGALKPTDSEDLVPALVELGVDKLALYLQPGVQKSRIHEKAQVRLRRLADQALKQAKRPFQMELEVFKDLHGYLERLPKIQHCGAVLEPGSKTNFFQRLAGSRSNPLEGAGCFRVIIGGERGLEVGELQACKAAGFEQFSFGSNILRARTAAIATASLLSLWRDDQHT